MKTGICERNDVWCVGCSGDRRNKVDPAHRRAHDRAVYRNGHVGKFFIDYEESGFAQARVLQKRHDAQLARVAAEEVAEVAFRFRVPGIVLQPQLFRHSAFADGDNGIAGL